MLDTAAELDVAVVDQPARPGRARGRPRRRGWARRLAGAGRLAVIAVVNDLTAGELTALRAPAVPLVVDRPAEPARGPASPASARRTSPAGSPRPSTCSVSATAGSRYVGGPPTARHATGRACTDTGPRWRPRTSRCRPATCGPGTSSTRTGSPAAPRCSTCPSRPTAVFAASDETAAGVIEAARTRGLRIPEDLSVVGFDDTEVARFASPPLTTVRQPLRQMGAVALRTAMRLAAGRGARRRITSSSPPSSWSAARRRRRPASRSSRISATRGGPCRVVIRPREFGAC